MKKIILLLLTLLPFLSKNAGAQCIMDVQNLDYMPNHCTFMGTVDFGNAACFDAENADSYSYTWKITSSLDGSLIATYHDFGFIHVFEKFGGYDFCLEVEKDGDPSNGPESVDCVSYTTCEICTGDKIEIEYLNCPYGIGCDIRLSTKIDAKNAVGLKPTAKYVITYLPTPQELAGGLESYDMIYDDIDVEFNASNDTILTTLVMDIPFKRGCFIPKIIFSLEDGSGGHDSHWMPCTEIVLQGEEKFRCIACGNDFGDCTASEVAADIANEEENCDLFTFCSYFRGGEESKLGNGEKYGINISPNPATDRIIVELPAYACESRKLVIFNSIGQPVESFGLPSSETTTEIFVTHLIEGLYLVAVVEYGEIAHSKQVIISKS